MNFFPVVHIAPADGDVFIGARSAQHAKAKALTLASATELSSARRKAAAEQYPYDTARLAYLGCLSGALSLDLITTTPVLVYADGSEGGAGKRATHDSAATEFFLLVIGLAAHYERARDLDRAHAVLCWADARANEALSTSVLAERVGSVVGSMDAWLGTLEIAATARLLRAPLKDVTRVLTARTLRELSTKWAAMPCARARHCAWNWPRCATRSPVSRTFLIACSSSRQRIKRAQRSAS